MKYLKNKRAYKEWAALVNRGQSTPIEPPKEYPCYGYLTVLSYAYEEDAAEYLYAAEIAEMAAAVGAKTSDSEPRHSPSVQDQRRGEKL